MLQANIFQPTLFEKPTLNITSLYVNTGVGTGQLASYIYGVSPLPAGPALIQTTLPASTSITGAWINPGERDPYALQYHVGYTRQLTGNMVLSADYTHVQGVNEFRTNPINPIENAWDPNAASYNTCGATGTVRRLRCRFGSVLGDPTLFGQINIINSDNRSRFDEFIVHGERRGRRVTFQASYTLSWANAFGGIASGGTGGGGGTPTPQNVDQPFAPSEWGPTIIDERHRVVLSGVFELLWGIQASPIFQIGSARPYGLTAGTDCNKDGTNNDRAFFLNGAVVACNTSGATQVSVNSARGAYSLDLDARATKFFKLGNENRKLALFAEFFNITNRANFGFNGTIAGYNGNALSGAAFEKPQGYLGGLPTSRQMQLGARFIF
jgi:hypothetical protein